VRCPRCSLALLDSSPDRKFPEVHALHCDKCDGLWMAQSDLHRLEQAVDVSWIEVRHVPPPEIQAELLTCPACSPARHLNKVQSDRDRKVVLDVCDRCHGVWLDGGELRAIQEKGVLSALVDAVRFFIRGR